MPDEKMENKIFDQIIGDKLRTVQQEGVTPRWTKMKQLLRANGFKLFSTWDYFLFGILGLSLALNVVLIFYKPQPVASHLMAKKIPGNSVRMNTFVKHDTLVIADTVYEHKVIYQKQYAALSAKRVMAMQNTSQRVGGKRMHMPESVKHYSENNKPYANKKTTENLAVTQRAKSGLIYKDRRMYKPGKQPGDSLKFNVPAQQKVGVTALNNKKSGVSYKKRNTGRLRRSDTTAKLPATLLQNKKINKQKKPFVVRFKLGAGLETAFITSKRITGTMVSYGIAPELRLTKRFAVYSGFWIIKPHFNFANGLLDFSSFSDVITDTSAVHEVNVTGTIYRIPLGVRVYFPVGSHFEISGYSAVNYLYFGKQTFSFEIKNPDETHLLVHLKNSYSGFGSVNFGLGASYIWRDKLSFSLLPHIEIPLEKTGAEKIKYEYFITRFIISWHF